MSKLEQQAVLLASMQWGCELVDRLIFAPPKLSAMWTADMDMRT
jgi:hypothetical protein